MNDEYRCRPLELYVCMLQCQTCSIMLNKLREMEKVGKTVNRQENRQEDNWTSRQRGQTPQSVTPECKTTQRSKGRQVITDKIRDLFPIFNHLWLLPFYCLSSFFANYW